MSDEQPAAQESAAKYFRHPGWRLAAVFLQYVVGPAVVAIITTLGLYYTQIRAKVKEDVRHEVDRREDTETAVRSYLGITNIAAVTTVTVTQPMTLFPLMNPEPIEVRTEIMPPVCDHKKLDELDEQLQVQSIPGELTDAWAKMRSEPLELNEVRHALERVQQQQQQQQQEDY